MRDKVVLVTGASRGIGKAIALAFGKRKARVIVNFFSSESEAEKVVSEIENYGCETFAIRCDVSNEKEVQLMFEKIIKEFGKLDILVNNAGVCFESSLNNKSVDEWKRTLDINLLGTFLCSKYASKYMKEGSIINISSTNGINTLNPREMDYDASKAGVISLTQNLAKVLSPNIRVNCIAPGWVETDMTKTFPQEFLEKEKSKILMQRFAQPSEIVDLVLFLVSDKAKFINCTTIVIDGGLK
jgi:3-oxoacyl-[acyl-carrier protein] reductase